MAHTFSAAEKTALRLAIDWLIKRDAYETPFDAQVIEQVAPVAVSSGFVGSTGDFKENAKLRPISTLLQFVTFIGT